MLKMKRGVPLSKFEAEMSAALLNVDIHSSGFMYGLSDKDDPQTVVYNYVTGWLEKGDLITKSMKDYKSLNQYLRMVASIKTMMESRRQFFAFDAVSDAIRSNTDAERNFWYWFIPKSIIQLTKDQKDMFDRKIGFGMYRLSAVPLVDIYLYDAGVKVKLKEDIEHQIISINRGFEAFYLIELPYYKHDIMVFEPELNGLKALFKRIKQVDGFVKNPY